MNPPKHLSRQSRAWWREVDREYDMTSSYYRLLQAACEAWDRLCQAREIISREGPVYQDRFGAPRKHPALTMEETARVQLARLYRELRLGDDGPPPDVRIPRRP